MDTIKLSNKETIREYILSETLGDKTKISDETLIFREGIFNSMGFVLILTYIQETFGIEVMDSELVEENFESINAIAEFINRKQGK
jgi:acyl carrier protein